MNILAKAGIATLGAGAIGSASFAGYSHFSKTSFKDNLDKSDLNKEDKSVRNHLKKIGYYVLEDKADEDLEWKKVFNEYRVKPQDAPKFDTNVVAQQDLINKCNKLLSNNFESNTNYSLIKKWCVKEETIETMLNRNGYTKIGASSIPSNTEKWNEKVALWKKDNENNNKIEVAFNGSEDATLLEKACDALKINETKTHADDQFEIKFIKARDWCSISTNKG